MRRRWLALMIVAALTSGAVTHTWLRAEAPPIRLDATAVIAPAPADAGIAPVVAESLVPGPPAPVPPKDVVASPLFIRALVLQRAGQLPEAAQVYRDVVAQSPHSEQAAAALIAFGQTQFGMRRYPEAATAFQRVIAEHPPGVLRGQALYWLGRVAQEAGDTRTAAARFTDAAALLPALDGYIRVQAADVLAAAGDFAGAVAQLDVAAKATATVAQHAEIQVKLAQFTGSAGDFAEATRRYRALLDGTQNPWERSGHQFKLAQSLRTAGNLAEWRQLLTDIIVRYPATSYAGQALTELNPAPGEIGALLEGVVAFYQRENDRAVTLLERAASDAAGDPGRALYFLGLLAERRDDPATAVALFDQLVRDHPTHVLVEEARWERAHMFEWLGQPHDAVAAYRELRQAHPNGQNAGESGFREGLMLYKLGEPAGAAAAWVQSQDGAAIPVRTRNLFWAGKALVQAGDVAEGHKLWQEAAALRPGSYYADRAQAMLNGGGAPVPATVTPLVTATNEGADQQQLADWLAVWASVGQPLPAVADVRATLAATLRLQRGDALLTLGLREQAVEEFRELRTEHRRDPVAQVALIGLFRERGLYHLASSAGYALLDLSGTALTHAPEVVQRVISPAPFVNLLNQEAVSRGVDPLVFLALIHQESAFDTGATSSAEALGLTQVVPSTGRAIAREMGVGDFEPEDLLRPVVSLQFGAQYLAEQLRLFNGNAVQALAAYNAGPGSALRWARAAGNDPDLFVEEIDYAQTSTYVKKIAENVARYRGLYGRGG